MTSNCSTGIQFSWLLEWFFFTEIVRFGFWVYNNFYFYSFSTAILVFRLFKKTSKTTAKTIHVFCHAVTTVLVLLGLSVEFISHYQHKEKDFYSLHSWLGMLTIIIFAGQFIVGLICFLLPTFNEKLKASYLKVHVVFGTFCFVLAIATSLVGFNQTARFNKKYSQLSLEGVLINSIGLMMVL